ncbi:MAG: TnpV protein [Nakamurella sp.]
MNRYGERAQRHYQQFLAPTYAMIPDHEVFFSTLGQEIEDQVFELRDQLAGPDPLGEGYLEKVGRLNAARLQAEEVVLAELLPAPEETQDEDDTGSNSAATWAMSFQQLKKDSLDR